ncbi:MAG: phosphoglucosamine mutase [Elusimicrobia bacterium]|nr:phosphoglucosamine mutase [Elusimicrobiota bacterium]
MKLEKKEIFGTDGIRAVAGESPLTEEELKNIGFAAGSFLQKKFKETMHASNAKIIIARDTRDSGPWIEKALAEGLSKSGCQVLSCGVLPTSSVSVLLKRNRFLAGAVISASHNPPDFNGVKFFTAQGEKIPESWEREIEQNLEILAGCAPSLFKQTKVEIFERAKEQYVESLKKSLPQNFSLKGVKWVIDCANGAVSNLAPEVFNFFGAELIAIHHSPDGKNINLKSGALYLESLRETVLREKADGGCAFDGDADRVLFVDEEAAVVDGDVLLGLSAQILKEKGLLKNNCVVTTVMANLIFFQKMKELDIQVLTAPVGDRSVSEMLESSGAVLGGEQSGHIIFKEFLPTGDGMFTALKVLSMLKEKKQKLSAFTKAYPKAPQILLNLKVKEKRPIENLPDFQAAVVRAEKFLGANGRILIRYSGTEPILRIMIEGSSKSQIEKIGNDLLEFAKKGLPHE